MATGAAQAIIDRQQWLEDLADAAQPLIKELFNSGGEVGRAAKDFLNGVWLGHPLHPVITDVPIGAWTVSELFDLLSATRGGDEMLDSAADLTLGTGVVAALGAAVTGITDWSDADGTQRRVGAAHAVLNVAGLTLTLGSLALRVSNGPRGLARTLSAGGYVISALAAYVAGDLVYGLGMAVNRDAWVEAPTKFVDAVAVGDLHQGEMVKADVRNNPVVLVQHDDGIHAFGGRCSHFGCPLWREGELDGHTVTCKCHGSQFDITNGKVLHGPATSPLPSYEVKEVEGKVQVRLKQ